MHASHVIIRGHVFTYDEKAPFVESGMSVLGALEFDEATDQTKCHECGEWQTALPWHIQKAHTMTSDGYRSEHGLSKHAGLSGMGRRKLASANAERQRMTGIGIGDRRRGTHRAAWLPVPAYKHSVEVQNGDSRCAAQLLYKIMICASSVGHTPTKRELAAVGVTQSTLIQRFGSVAAAMDKAGLQSNSGTISPLPRNYPGEEEIRAKWDAPMPWPKEYFDAGHIGLEQRRG
jgi:hypothetical protein